MSEPLLKEPADPITRAAVRELVVSSVGDPLAPFALRPEKNYVFSPDGRAAVAYRIKVGVAVASGDPLGDEASWPAVVEEFLVRARARKLRVAVLGAGERSKSLWEQYHFGSLSIGRDVVVERSQFTLKGRAYRNVRQAIQRSHNAGVKVTVQREGELEPEVVAELRALMTRTERDDNRGFSMILGRLFDGEAPDAIIAIARDCRGGIVGAHRYLWAGRQDLSFDLPIRSRTAPNGVDERLVAEVVDYAADLGVERVSLAFAPFPDLFADKDAGRLTWPGRLGYALAHLLDPLIKVEALYRYLRKFRAFGDNRYVMLRWRQLVPVLLALLLLEFGG
ncbi:MAG: bifunctional lysylphosphatidylglycerol flippase/synthetase MprF [Jatrophihabitans sp.]|uniref:bifunctional lysylphosphatidylglycerol flippase/synthetase MprF n=1 Tax=Jatrophihabitans sp. TaxID=1932789 RepID=UPI003F803DA0